MSDRVASPGTALLTSAGSDRAATHPGSRDRRRLAAGFTALVALTTLLIVLGALVRAHGAGLACPDWPLCFGNVVPQMNLEIAFEWSHRTLAAGISLSFFGLAALALRRRGTPVAVRRLLAVAAGLLVTQILLGALTVWLQLASWTVTAHLITGNSFSLTVLLVACSLRDPVKRSTRRAAAPTVVRRVILAGAVLLLLQMILGGLVSSNYAGMACPEWPTCNGGLWIPAWGGNVGLHLLHRFNGYALIVVLAVAAAVSRGDPSLRRWTALAFALASCEVLVGIANVRLGIPVEVTGLHSGLAAALVLTWTLAVREALRRSPAAA
jgi:cytochrome c oxidase assembly protein subunit 15